MMNRLDPVARKERLDRLLPILACPACGGGLQRALGPELSCLQCAAKYPLRDNVPILLPDFMPEAGVGVVSAEDPVSKHPYSPASQEIIDANPQGWVLDLGAGAKHLHTANVVQVDIFRYPMTDVVASADCLPFKDNAFRAVISQAVFEHLQYPEAAAGEVRRVLQPGGTFKIDTAFLQPEHGYPHHFFNATETGLRHWFRDFDVQWSGVETYQHPKWSLSWFLGVYLDRVGVEHSSVLSRTTVGALLAILERLAAGNATEDDQVVVTALDALPPSALRMLAAGVSVQGKNLPKNLSDTGRASRGVVATDVSLERKLSELKQGRADMEAQACRLNEGRVLAMDRANYLLKYHPSFAALSQIGLRSWLQFKAAKVLRSLLPTSWWFRLRNAYRAGHLSGSDARQDQPFVSFCLEPFDVAALIDTFFSLVRQTHGGWELVLSEHVDQHAAVRQTMWDMARLDSRVRVVPFSAERSEVHRRAMNAALGQFCVQLPERVTLVFEAVHNLFALAQNCPNVVHLVADYECTFPSDAERMLTCIQSSVTDVRFTQLSVVSQQSLYGADTPSSDGVQIAYIPKVLFRVQYGPKPAAHC